MMLIFYLLNGRGLGMSMFSCVIVYYNIRRKVKGVVEKEHKNLSAPEFTHFLARLVWRAKKARQPPAVFDRIPTCR